MKKLQNPFRPFTRGYISLVFPILAIMGTTVAGFIARTDAPSTWQQANDSVTLNMRHTVQSMIDEGVKLERQADESDEEFDGRVVRFNSLCAELNVSVRAAVN